MKSEIEAKFLDVDFVDIRSKLQVIGAQCKQPMRLMKRAIIDHPTNKNAFIRVRDEGDTVTLTLKQFDSLSVDGAKEIETTVGSFDDTVKIFESTGLKVRSVQESKRETWQFNDVEIVLDEWPWLKPYIEIEGESESGIKSVAKDLGFEWNKAVFGDVMAAYRVEYPHLATEDTIGSLPSVRFDDAIPDLLKAVI